LFGPFQNRAILFWTRFQVRAVPPLPLRYQAVVISAWNSKGVIAAMPGTGLQVLQNMQPERRRSGLSQ